MKIVQKFIVFEKREKRHGKGKFIKITWQGPFTEKSYSLSIPFWGGSHKWQCLIRIRIVPMYVLLHYFPQVELEVWKFIGGSHYDIGHDGLKGIFIKVCLQNFTREKDIYRGVTSRTRSEITQLHKSKINAKISLLDKHRDITPVIKIWNIYCPFMFIQELTVIYLIKRK